MAYKKAVPEKKREVKLSDIFINEYMPDANGNFVKVYLLGLSQCTKESPLTLKQMADKLCLPESEVVNAWNYWSDRNVVVFDGENIEFLELDEKKTFKNIETKPIYSAEEITYHSASNKQLGDMLRMVEKIIEKPLSSNDLVVLYSLYDYYRLPLDVIPMLITYCVKNGKKSMRQIEKTASAWTEKGIDSIESAEIYLKKAEEYTKSINNLRKSMGINTRNFSPTEIKHINAWLFDLKIPFDLIIFAFEQSTLNGKKFSIKNMDTLINSWYNKGITSVNQAKSFTGMSTATASKATPTKFTNFDQPEYDFDAFERKSIGRTKSK